MDYYVSLEEEDIVLTVQVNGRRNLYRVFPTIYKGDITLTKKLFYALIASALLMISGCSNEGETTTVTIDSIDAEEVLTLNPYADIFQFDGVIYETKIDWVEELSLTKDVQIGEIKAKNDTNTDFEDEMSNKLPIGAKIFSAKERGDILIVESEGETKKYLALVEG